jgi:hypothetical protein
MSYVLVVPGAYCDYGMRCSMVGLPQDIGAQGQRLAEMSRSAGMAGIADNIEKASVRMSAFCGGCWFYRL